MLRWSAICVGLLLVAFAPPLTEAANVTHTGESIWLLPGAIPGLALTFAGYRFIGTTIFVVAAALAGAIFFTSAPHIFPDTPFCCGHNGTLTGLIVVSVVVGLIVGLIARWLLRVGIFLVGACLGLGLALGLMATPLHDVKTFQTEAGVILLYVICMLVFGILAVVLLRKFFLIFTTSFGGALLFILGVDYFVKSNFDVAVIYGLNQFKWALRDAIKDHASSFVLDRRFDRNTYILLASFLTLAVAGFYVQYTWGHRDSHVQRRVLVDQRIWLRNGYSSDRNSELQPLYDANRE